MKILGIAYNLHDHNSYDGVLHNQVERHSRVKHNQSQNLHDAHHTDVIKPAFNGDYDVVAVSASKRGITRLTQDPHEDELSEFKDIYDFVPTTLWENIHRDGVYYIDHHQSHAAYAFLGSGFEESDILAIDGVAMGGRRCFFFDKNGTITDLSLEMPIGWIWNHVSCLTDFGSLGAGKLMGLAASGKYSEWFYNIIDILVDEIAEGRQEQLSNNPNNYKIKELGLEDFAFTLQQYTLDKIKECVYPLKTSDNLCIAGGVAYNGYMNEQLTDYYVKVFVPPAVGDEGQSIGNYMHANYVLNNEVHVPNVFAGIEHTVDESMFLGYNWYEGGINEIQDVVVDCIADGGIVGWYQGKSESGHRALGNRSILADPRNPDIKDIINKTIKLREDFRPFAPSCMEEHYQDYFDTNQPSPFMSRIVPVTSNKVPGITHIDNTARVQTVNKEFNERFHGLLSKFYDKTGIPMLLNTSFNCQEPIVETPREALATFAKTGLDILVINNYIIWKEND